MEDCVDKISSMVVSRKVQMKRIFRFNYFEKYVSDINSLSKQDLRQTISFVEDNIEMINDTTMNDIIHYFSLDTSNKNCAIKKSDVKKYVLYCLYMYVNDKNIHSNYTIGHTDQKLIIEGKLRPDTHHGSIYDLKSNTFIECYVRYISERFESVSKLGKLFEIIKQKNYPMPLFQTDIGDDHKIFAVENLCYLDPYSDPFVEVLKDLLNQLKCINRYYFLEFITPRDLGKSKNTYQRYYINRFDSLIEKNEIVSTFNVYDGRQRYNTITQKDQIRTIINILSEVYTMGKKDYRDCITEKPFSTLLVKLDSIENDHYEEMLDFLMTDYGFLQTI